MRILVAALGSPGHAFPLVPLARALDDAGHDVVFSVGPGTDTTIATAGLETLTTGRAMFEGFREVMAARGLAERPTDPEALGSVAGEAFGSVLPRAAAGDLIPWLAEHRPDVVISEVGNPGAALAARSADIPCVLHSFGRRPPPASPMSMSMPPMLAAVAADLGVPLAEGDATGHAYLDICPPSLQEPESTTYLGGMTELPLRPVGWNPPTPFTSRLRGDRPWVLLTLGTAFGEAGVLRSAIDGIASPDVDVVVATGSVERGELADLDRDGVQVEGFVPQADLLAGRVEGVAPPAVVVHHGGSGTTLSCAAAGVPQLLLPRGADQFFNAGAVAGVGAGRQLVGEEATPSAVGKAVVELLGEGPERPAARALAAEVAALPSPADVAASVEQWALPR